ncbi:MAG: TetR/AcrR family transcriptional regulator [Chitinophagales bacterium]
MELQLRIKMNERLYLRDPEGTELGRKIVREAIKMIESLGFEDFTFKKLAEAIGTTEATIYRYFENKHRLLLYIIAWYWAWMEYLVIYHVNNLDGADRKIRKVIELLSNQLADNIGGDDLDKKALFNVVIYEVNKVYLTKEVNSDNQLKLFKPYKDLCARIAGMFSEYNSSYKYSYSLASTLLEMAHLQYFFMQNLPALTDFGTQKNSKGLQQFLEHLIFSSLNEGKRK